MSALLCKAMPGARSGHIVSISAEWENSVLTASLMFTGVSRKLLLAWRTLE